MMHHSAPKCPTDTLVLTAGYGMPIAPEFMREQKTSGIEKRGETMSKPEIVWRNPNRLLCHPRRHNPLENDNAWYILEEFVGDEDLGYWTTISEFEVLPGGTAA
jgi:hypothetical protein